MTDIVRRLRQPPFGTEASERNLMSAAADEIERLRIIVQEARRAIGEHSAPDDCYATGPLTGDAYRDLVECPACSFIQMCEAGSNFMPAIAKAEGR